MFVYWPEFFCKIYTDFTDLLTKFDGVPYLYMPFCDKPHPPTHPPSANWCEKLIEALKKVSCKTVHNFYGYPANSGQTGRFDIALIIIVKTHHKF